MTDGLPLGPGAQQYVPKLANGGNLPFSVCSLTSDYGGSTCRHATGTPVSCID